jgi:putative inorganic carbon (HCO3(-)) transporter
MNNRLKYTAILKGNAIIVAASILSLIFLVISLLMINEGGGLLWLLPTALIMVFIAFTAIDKILFLVVFLAPLSIQLRFINPDVSSDIFIPTELMLAGILILIIFKLFVGKEINKSIICHPVSIIIICILCWSLITSMFSTLPFVSLKSFITKLWFLAGFYLLASEIFSKHEKIQQYFSAYLAGMLPVVIYYLIRMWQSGIFNQKSAYKAIRPFFNDHTSFGAAVAFCIPVIIYFLAWKKISNLARAGLLLLLFIFVLAFVFSYSRAAWLSLIAATLVTLFLVLKISWKVIVPVMIAGIVVIFVSLSDIIIQLKENKQDSSDDLKSHLQSVSNIRSDVSNVERLNRWNCAIRMFREKPGMGWGPATYQFNYAPFQIASEKTIISTNWGEGGNAHSEYLGSLVDSGVPGLFLYVLLLIYSFTRGIVVWKYHKEKQMRYLSLAMVAGLTTYIIHGTLNNFLDTDKISALFWGMIAAIVAMDINMKSKKEENRSPEVGSNN